MRLFVAIDIDEAIRDRIAHFVDGVRSLAPSARWVSVVSLHVTLKFIGEQSPSAAEAIVNALSGIRCAPVALKFRGTGYFPDLRSPRVFWVGIEPEVNLSALAAQIDKALTTLGISGEERAFSPHLTLARGGGSRHPRGGSGTPQLVPGDKPNRSFLQLHDRLTQLPLPEFGAMIASEFFLYESKLSSAGAHYTKLAGFRLGHD